MEPVVGVSRIRKLSWLNSHVPSRHSVRLGLLLVVPFALAISTALALSSNHVVYPVLTALFYSYSIAVSVVVGAYWWSRRPDSHTGDLLYALGMAFAVSAWQSADNALIYSIGVAADAVLTALLFLLVLTYPRGRFERRADRLLMVALVGVLIVAFVPRLTAWPMIHGGIPVFSCDANCPPNAFQLLVLPQQTLLVLDSIAQAAMAVVAVGVLLSFLDRMRQRPVGVRRAAAGLAATSLIVLPAIVVFVLASVVLAPSDSLLLTSAVLLVGAVMLFPIGFAVPLVQADLDAAGAMRSLLHDLATDPSPRRWREHLATLLDDPSVKVGYWRPGSARYTAADGTDFAEADIDAWHWIPVENGAEPVAAIAINPAAEVDPELGRALAEATAVAIAADEVRDARTELSYRAAEAAGYERERMAREVQAGTQQRLAAMRVQLAVWTEKRDGDGDLAQVGRDLDRAISELRDVIYTTEPTIVTRGGVGRALRGVRGRAPIPVLVFDRDLHRHPAEAELAVYYCCLEAIQNAVKHAGPSATVTIRLADSYPDGIRFSVIDDGRGFDPEPGHHGAGLQNMHERVTALGGQLTIGRGRDGGTVVSGSVRDQAEAE